MSDMITLKVPPVHNCYQSNIEFRKWLSRLVDKGPPWSRADRHWSYPQPQSRMVLRPRVTGRFIQVTQECEKEGVHREED